MALIKISDNIYVNSDKVSWVEGKKDKTWVTADGESKTIDITLRDFLNKFAIAEQSSGRQHFAG